VLTAGGTNWTRPGDLTPHIDSFAMPR
jgi:hypothetical protein